MNTRAWTDMIVGDRMAVDQEFSLAVENSQFTRQEWGLIMTAVELDIEHPEDEERARLVADTEKLPHVLPELDNVREGMNAMGGGGAGGSGRSSGTNGGVFSSLRRALGFESDDEVDEGTQEAAVELAQRYADQLQARLEERGKWDEIRAAARS